MLACVDAAGAVVCVTGTDDARAGHGGVRAEGAVGSAPGRGGTDGTAGTRSGVGDVEVTGLVELLGLFVQALSLKPDAAAEFDLGGNGDCTCEMANIARK